LLLLRTPVSGLWLKISEDFQDMFKSNLVSSPCYQRLQFSINGDPRNRQKSIQNQGLDGFLISRQLM
jgi:hypothetical protein